LFTGFFAVGVLLIALAALLFRAHVQSTPSLEVFPQKAIFGIRSEPREMVVTTFGSYSFTSVPTDRIEITYDVPAQCKLRYPQDFQQVSAEIESGGWKYHSYIKELNAFMFWKFCDSSILVYLENNPPDSANYRYKSVRFESERPDARTADKIRFGIPVITK
jgi:hypothetical protein